MMLDMTVTCCGDWGRDCPRIARHAAAQRSRIEDRRFGGERVELVLERKTGVISLRSQAIPLPPAPSPSRPDPASGGAQRACEHSCRRPRRYRGKPAPLSIPSSRGQEAAAKRGWLSPARLVPSQEPTGS